MIRVHLLAAASVFLISAVPASGVEDMPEEAAKYHRVLLRRPHQATLFDRFQGAWLDARSSDELEAFLVDRAEEEGGAHWSLLARHHLRRGQDEKALGALGEAIRVSPEDAVLRIERARVNVRRLDFEAAVADLEEAREADDEADALRASKMLGRVLLRSGDAETAETVWDETLEAHPGDENLLEDLVELAAAEGEIEQALAFMERLLEATDDPYHRALRRMRRGDLLGTAGRVDDALAAYDATLAAVGQGSWLEREVLAQIDKLFQKEGRGAGLRDHLEGLAEEHPGRLLIHRMLAKREAAEGDMDAAIGRFREVLKRSPGERELREEFVRMLADGDRLEDAIAELEKLIERAPDDAGLRLRMAGLRDRADQPQETLAALETARERLGGGEADDLRVAGLMLEYGLEEAGRALLRERMEAEGAGPAPAEMLASHYSRIGEKDEALPLLEDLAAEDDLDTVLRATSSIASLGESGMSFDLLSSRREDFGSEPRFLEALLQGSMAAERSAETTDDAMKLVRLAAESGDLGGAVGLAARVMAQAEEMEERIESLREMDAPGIGERCLLAELLEQRGDFEAADELLTAALGPTVTRFHVALLEGRGELGRAVETLEILGDTEEGRTVSYLKDLAGLQRRAGERETALATAERWKQRAPGDKAAWLFRAELLEHSGKYDEAVRETRKAVARFDGDPDLAARLSALYADRGNFAEAESILWQLYDEAETPAEQARWAARLAETAVGGGRARNLEERLMERTRMNRRSVGPLLARAELARLLEEPEKRRDLLLEAVRLRPEDLELRLQVAGLAEDDGEFERAQAILEEALPFDENDRVRRVLARMYLRQGMVTEGLRQLRALAGSEAPDPRELERTTMSLARSGYYEEGIVMLRDGLAGGGDWHARYLLASMLEEDGRELEAIPVFLELLDAEGDIDGLSPASRMSGGWIDQQPPAARPLLRMAQCAQLAYAHRGNRHYGGSAGTLFQLPPDPESVRMMALAHLFQLEQRLGEDAAENIGRRLEARGIGDLDLLRELARDGGNRMQWAELAKNHSDNPGVLTLNLIYLEQLEANGASLDEEILEKAAGREDIAANLRFKAVRRLLMKSPADASVCDRFLAVSEEMIDGDGNSWGHARIAGAIIGWLGGEDRPEELVERMKGSLRELVDARNEKGAPRLSGDSWIAAKRTLDDSADPVELLVEAVGSYREELGGAGHVAHASRRNMARHISRMVAQGMSMAQLQQYVARTFGGQQGRTEWSLDSLSLETLPYWLRTVVPPAGTEAGAPGQLEAADLLEELDGIESPVLRAWIALRSEDEAAIERALAADVPAAERRDMAMLRLVPSELAPATRFERLAELRRLTTSRPDLEDLIDVEMLRVAVELEEDERGDYEDDLRALLIRSRSSMGAGMGAELAMRARELGFEDLAERFGRRPGGAAAGGALSGALSGATIRGSSGGTGGQPSDPLEKIRDFTDEGKHEAAARLAMEAFRESRNQHHFQASQIQSGLLDALDDEGVEALETLADPGDSKSRTKRMDYVDICGLLGEDEKRREMLESMLAERPNDPELAARLAFEPGLDDKRVSALLDVAAGSGDALAMFVRQHAEPLVQGEDTEACLRFFRRTAAWLETADPDALESANLSWVAYFGKQFLGRLHRVDLPSLLGDSGGDDEETDEAEKERERIARRMCEAMLRHGDLAEAGFRLLWAWDPEDLEPETLDRHARAAIVAPAPSWARHSHGRVFGLVTGRSTSSSGDELNANSSWRWLARRAGEVGAETVLPRAFLDGLSDHKPEMASLLERFVAVEDIEDVRAFWEAPELEQVDDASAHGVRQALAERAVEIEGAGEFFLGELEELPEGDGRERLPDSVWRLARHALGLAAGRDDDGMLDRIVAALERAAIGADADWSDVAGSNMSWQALNGFESFLRVDTLPPARTVRAYAAMFRAGVPMGSNEWAFRESFRKVSGDGAEDYMRFFEEAGLLADVEVWVPPGGVYYEHRNSAAGPSVGLHRIVVLENAVGQLGLDAETRKDLIAALEQREEGRFGALMLCAALTDDSERGEWTAKALREAGDGLVSLPESRKEMLHFAFEWLPDDALADFPAEIAAALDSAAEQRREALREEAERVRAEFRSGASQNDPFQMVRELVPRLAEGSLAEAVALFSEAERVYTDGLARGGRFSSWTTSSFSVSERDAALYRVLGELEDRGDTLLAPRFLVALMEDPVAGRLSWTGPSSEDPFEQAAGPFGEELRLNRSGDHWLDSVSQLIERTRGLDAGLRGPVFAGGLKDYLDNWSRWDAGNADQARARVEGMEEDVWLKTARAAFGLLAWNDEGADRHAEVRRDLLDFLRSDEIAMLPKFELARGFIEERPAAFATPEIAAALADLFDAYAAGERSAVNPAGGMMVRTMLELEETGEGHAAARRVADTVWENSREAKAAGHSEIPEEMARDLYLLAKLSGHEAAATLLPQVRRGLDRDFLAVLHVVRAGDHDLARALLPGNGEDFERWRTKLVWSAAVEEPFEAFLAKLEDPERRLRLMVMSTAFEPASANRPAGLGRREAIERLLTTYLEAPEVEPTLAAQVLNRVSDVMPWDDRLGPASASWAKDRDVPAILNAALTSERGSVVERQANAELAVCTRAAGWELAAGRTGLMESFVEGWREPGERDYRFEQAFQNSVSMLAWSMIDALIDGRTGHFGEGAGPMADLAIFAGGVESLEERPEISTPLVLSRMMRLMAGTEDQAEEHLRDAPERVRTVFGEIRNGDTMLLQIARTVSSHDLWKSAPSAAFRQAYARAVIAHEPLTAKLENEMNWTQVLDQVWLRNEMIAVAAEQPPGLAPGLAATLHGFRGMMLRDRGDPETAEKLMREAIDGATGRNFRNEMKVELAGLLGATGRAGEGLVLLETMAGDDKPDWLRSRYDGKLEELKKAVGR